MVNITTTMANQFLSILIIVLAGSPVVMTAQWRQARDVFLSNVESLRAMVKRQPSYQFSTRDLLGMTKNEDVKEVDSATSVQGTNIMKYSETFKGLPVFDASLTVEKDTQTNAYTGQVTGWLATGLEDDNISTEPNLTEEEAVQLALIYGNFSMTGARIDNDKPQLMIYVQNKTGILVYKVQYFAVTQEKNYRFCMMIDATNGKLVDKWNMLETAREKYKLMGPGGNKLIGKMIYGDDLPYLQVRRSEGECYYINGAVKVVSLGGKEYLDNEPESTYHVNCKEGSKDETNGGYSPVNDALFYGNVVYNMYMEWVKVPPKKELPMVFRVHYGKNMVQANYNGRNFTFGDGDKTFLPLVSLDIVAHEVSHCFTEEHSGLKYESQSGGIDEAFSDLAGEAAEMFEYEWNDWSVGADVSENPLRNICDQSQDGSSIINARDYNNNLDVHYTSGVFNRFFCLLGKHEDWDVQKVFRVTAMANRFYWHPTTNFEEGACDIAKATYDLGYDVAPVVKAFDDVGIKMCDISRYIRTIHEDSVIENLGSVPGEEVMFKVRVFQKLYKTMKFTTTGGSGGVDMYVCYNKVRCPKHLTKWRSNLPGTSQTIEMKLVKRGRYFVILKSKPRSFFSDVTLKVTMEEN
ncbi:uncharacterized protein LOC115226755 [Argonauta hians]